VGLQPRWLELDSADDAALSDLRDRETGTNGKVQSAGGCCLVVGDKIDFTARTGGMEMSRRCQFAARDGGPMDAVRTTSGTLTTRPVKLPRQASVRQRDAPEASCAARGFEDKARL